MHAQLQNPGGKDESNRACDQITDLRLLFMLPAPRKEAARRDRNHQNDRNDQRRDAAFADDDLLKLRHFPSPPQTSTQKPLWPQAGQVSLRAVGV